MKKTIYVVCPFPEGVAAGQRLKYEQYFEHWRDNGYEVIISNFMDEAMWSIVYKEGNLLGKVLGTFRGHCKRLKDLMFLNQADLVYIFMWVTPFGTKFFEWLFLKLSKKVIYDIEDNVLIQGGSSVNPFTRLLKSASKIEYLIKNSDHVITSSPALNDDCLKLNKFRACTFISSTVDVERFLPKNDYSNVNKVTIGWTGTFSSKMYLDGLRGVFLELKKRRDFRLRVIGNFEYTFPEMDLDVVQWSKENEVTDLQVIDIGVYPLALDEFVLGKSGLKAIQYMAFALPTVATNVGTVPTIIEHMNNGLLVKTEIEWVEALETLLDDCNLRKKLGVSAREKVINSYSIQATEKIYLNILEEVTSK